MFGDQRSVKQRLVGFAIMATDPWLTGHRLTNHRALFTKKTIFAHDKINDRVWDCQF
jgi:hypothetical protein